MLESDPWALLPGEKNSNDRDDMAVSPMVNLLTHQGSIFARICPNYYPHLGVFSAAYWQWQRKRQLQLGRGLQG